MDPSGPFTISELSRATGVSVASVKFYLREKLLPTGDPTQERRAYYGGEHVERLRLIRALRDVGGISVSAIRRIVNALQGGRTPTLKLIASTLDAAMLDGERPNDNASVRQVAAEVATFLGRQGVPVAANAHSLLELARAVSAIREISRENIPIEALSPYLKAAREIATFETDAALLHGDPQTALRRAVLGTILWERVLVSLRRIMHEHFAAKVFDRQERDDSNGSSEPPSARPRRARKRTG